MKAIYDLGLGPEIRVSSVIRGNSWNFPRARTHKIAKIFELITAYCSPQVDYDDEVVWTAASSSKFNLKSAVTPDQNLDPAPRLHMVWFKGKISKHAFCLWIAIQKGLRIKSLPAPKNIVMDTNCILWNGCDKDTQHLMMDISVHLFGPGLRLNFKSQLKLNRAGSLLCRNSSLFVIQVRKII